MSSDPRPFDPYRSPTLPQGADPGPTPIGRTGWLTTLCVLCIVLGALGLANSGFGAIGMFVGPKFQRMMAAQPQPGMSPEMQDAQRKMQEEMYAVQTKYFVPLAAGIFFRVIVGTLLVVGGVKALGLAEFGRQLLLIACAIAVVFEILQSILQSFMAMENMSVMHGFMEAMAKDTGGKAAQIEGIMKVVANVVSVISLILIGVISLAKIALYIFGLIYLRKPQIIARFNASQPLAPTPT